MDETPKTLVHVVMYYTPQSSGGFDWYFKKEDADADYQQSLGIFADCPETLLWQRTHETTLTDCDAITDEIDGMQVA
jgi:hypothetical protein